MGLWSQMEVARFRKTDSSEDARLFSHLAFAARLIESCVLEAKAFRGRGIYPRKSVLLVCKTQPDVKIRRRLT